MVKITLDTLMHIMIYIVIIWFALGAVVSICLLTSALVYVYIVRPIRAMFYKRKNKK